MTIMGNTWSRGLRQTANVTLNLLSRSLSNDDGDGNENGKKATERMLRIPGEDCR